MSRFRVGFVAIAIAVAGVVGWSAFAAAVTQVSQRDRAFNPKTVEVARGDTLRVVNDDGELVHHAYIKSADFNFDSGEQTPGSHTDIVMSTAGTFEVRCLIHPKMRLSVTVK